jgi:mitogen-activated protein kinase kinase kinase
MAMLASKSPYSAPAMGGSAPSQPPAQYNSSSSSYRTHATPARTEHAFFASPTESEFSEIYDAPDSVRYAHYSVVARQKLTQLPRHWNEEKVGDWLKSINCSQYVDLFKRKAALCILWSMLLTSHR